MRRTIQPSLEGLETKAMLSGVSATVSGLVSSMTAVAGRSLSGAQVVARLTETNVTSHDISVTVGPSIEGFTVAQGNQAVWTQHAGQLLPGILQVHDLKPYQSLTVSATWDGRANAMDPNNPWAEGPPLSGTFTIKNALDHGVATATVSIPRAWTVPIKSVSVTPPHPHAMVHEMAAASGDLKVNPSAS